MTQELNPMKTVLGTDPMATLQGVIGLFPQKTYGQGRKFTIAQRNKRNSVDQA